MKPDRTTRRLRALSAVVFLALLIYIVLDGQPDNATTFGSLVGALIVTLGLEIGIRGVKIERRKDDEEGSE